MADPLSITAAVLQLSTSVIACIRAANRLYWKSKDHAELIKELEELQDVVKTLQETDDCPDDLRRIAGATHGLLEGIDGFIKRHLDGRYKCIASLTYSRSIQQYRNLIHQLSKRLDRQTLSSTMYGLESALM